MITIFNRKELYLTDSLELVEKIRAILAGNKIDYKVNMRLQSGKASNLDNAKYLNYIYVHKQDYENAQQLISPLLRGE